MKISLQWLKDYVELDASAEALVEAITFLGFEVDRVVSTGAPKLDGVVVGEVRTREKHPNADKLSVCQVDVGPAGGVKTIVCGAQNYQVGDRVPVALPGAVLPGNFVIKQSKIRGHLSDGMMCSAAELGLGEDSGGLLILAARPEIGLPINSVLPAGDSVLELEITPNRPDCLSHLGIARELAAKFGKRLKYPQVTHQISAGNVSGGEAAEEETSSLLTEVRVDAPDDCPLYIAQVVTGVKIGPSPSWMQERLAAVGLRPVNNVVDVGNYVMLEYGQPLHAFDARKLGGRIVVRRAADGEKIVTLDKKERALNQRMLVIADAARPVVVAGIMGGVNSGVSEETTDLVLECAIFKPIIVRRTSKWLGLSSDSSYRYERGVDPHTASEAAGRAIDLILATAGGRIGPSFTIGGDVPWRREITLATGFVRERLGFDIPDSEMKAALEALELRVVREEPTPRHGVSWTVAIPSWRADLDRPIDLVEEILRIYGTDRIPPAVVTSPGLTRDDDRVVRFNRRAMDYLVGHDFHECMNVTLRSSREVATWISNTAAQELCLANPFAEDQSHLRPTLIIGLLESLKLNQSRGVPVSRLAETGRIFIEHNGSIYECASVAFLMVDDPERHWRRRESADFYTVKHHVAALAQLGGIDLATEPLSSLNGASLGWQEGHAATAGDIERGWAARFGLLNLAGVNALAIEGKIYAGVLAILPERLQEEGARPRYADFSLFPPALRDLALVVDAAASVEDVRSQLERIARATTGSAFAVESLEVFDVYQGKGLPADRKSVAFSLVFRAADRTLTDAEVNTAFQKIQEEILKGTSYQIRK